VKKKDNNKGKAPNGNNEDISSLLYGNLPPQCIDMERAVLGSILFDQNFIIQVTDTLTPEKFYRDAHVIIFQAMLDLYHSSEPIDMLTVIEKLKLQGKMVQVGGAIYISELSNNYDYSSNIKTHALHIAQKWMQREIIRLSHLAIETAYEDTTDVFEMLDDTIVGLTRIIQDIRANKLKTAKEVGEQIQKSIATDEPMAEIIDLGFCDLSTIKKTFNVIGGAQGTGKTAMILTIAKNLASNEKKVGIISIEMTAQMLGARIMQTQTGIAAKKILSNALTEREKKMLLDLPSLTDRIIIDEDSKVNHENIIQKITMMVAKHNIDIVFIDYLQLISIPEKSNPVTMMENITSRLQRVAKELNISVIGLSQLTRTNEKPSAASLRGGGIEQAASDVWILHDEYFKDDQGLKWNDMDERTRGKLLLINAKSRYGQTDNKDIFFNKPYQLMSDWNNKPGSKEIF
jgi:replicative DNA helicase